MRIVCTGGREYIAYDVVNSVLSKYRNAEIIVGDARGLDSLVRQWCNYNKEHPNVYKADWDRYGRGAGPRRNGDMLDTNPDLVIAFPGGRGTADCVKQARQRNIPVKEIT